MRERPPPAQVRPPLAPDRQRLCLLHDALYAVPSRIAQRSISSYNFTKIVSFNHIVASLLKCECRISVKLRGIIVECEGVMSMASRGSTVGIVLLLGLALASISNEAFARSGGSGGHGGASGRSSSRSSGIHSSAKHQHEGHLRQHRRGGLRTGLFVYPTTVPSNSAPYELPSDNNSSPQYPTVTTEMPPSPSRVNIIEYHMGCQTETVMVRWESGEEHAVNIVRCLR